MDHFRKNYNFAMCSKNALITAPDHYQTKKNLLSFEQRLILKTFLPYYIGSTQVLDYQWLKNLNLCFLSGHGYFIDSHLCLYF